MTRGLTNIDVIEAYELLLNRPPESDAVIKRKIGQCKCKNDLYTNIIESFEFKLKHPSDFLNIDKWILCDIDNFKMYLNLADKPISRNIITNKYEIGESKFIKKIIKNGDVVIDIGANIGYYTCIFSKLVGDNGRVISFEPVKKIYNILSKNICINNIINCNIYNYAIYNDNINKYMKINELTDNIGNSYITDEAIYENKIICKKLENLIDDKLNFIKIDTEGCEYIIIESNKYILDYYKPTIMVEINNNMLKKVSKKNSNDLIKLLNKYKYKVYTIDKCGNPDRILIEDINQQIINCVCIPE